MKTATTRMKAMVTGGVALVAFGLILPANAASNQTTGRPENGSVGNAGGKIPPGQSATGDDGNNGWQCDNNKGIGQGNPAHANNCPTTVAVTPPPPPAPPAVVPPVVVPPADVPAAQVPPADVPAAQVPPADVPAAGSDPYGN